MILKIIKNRRSVYPPQYNDTPITREDIYDILEAANYAPTHKRTQPWRFKIMHSETSKKAFGEALSEAYKAFAPKFSKIQFKKIKEKPVKSGAVIAVCMKRDENVALWEEQAAVAMAVQNMWLLTTEKGIGAYWGTPPFANKLNNFFKLEETEVCLGFFFMGHTDEFPEDWNRRPVEKLTQWL